jgi:hydroxymethylpyrimidine/phosphomethylpyrimidine kinase
MGSPKVVWTIAGFDPSSGAGITADLKTISSLECYGVACITALTVQNTLGVRLIEPIAPQLVRETLEALLEDLPPNSIKIGMLATAGIATVVADFVAGLQPPRCPVILDPMLRSSSGAVLLDEPGVQILRERLLPLATVITPNRMEAAVLSARLNLNLAVADPEALARALRQLGPAAVVVTGGDAVPGARRNLASKAASKAGPGESEDDCSDVLAYALGGMELMETLSAPRIHSQATHGTGCAFSTAIACALAHGATIPSAVTSAKLFVRKAIERAPGVGHGNGPMGLDRVRASE